ncbi:hypothetical protein [Candidatus Methylomirabilis sp.]|uniref:DUF6941 family protein n=1 Tax=Candidatus Methylomirabilis sp. TaxID=2032687 RepID=UPI002A628C37|nr:hypothetical protein [Candidatus Methylomirabilis sp.]
MTRSKEAKLDYWLLCDTVRREDSGKLIIVGVYMPDIGVPAVPMTLPMLSFLFKWDLTPGPLRAGAIAVNGPAGQEITRFPVEDNTFGEGRQTGVLAFGISPFVIDKAGTFTVIYHVGNRSKTLGSFRVILQQTAKP